MAKVITLKKELVKDGVKIGALNLDFDKATGNVIIAAEKEARLLGDNTPDLCYSKTFQAIIASKVANEPVVVDDILGLSARDFIQITTTVSNFLFEWALPENLQVK